MDVLNVPWFSVVVGSVFVYFLYRRLWKVQSGLPLPPGPPPLPIVGNLLQLGGGKATEVMLALSQQYGPLMTLRLGTKTVMVVSSPAMAKEVLKTQDHNLAGRWVLQAAKTLDQHKSSIGWAEYGPHWKKLRRISSTELMTSRRLQALQHLRSEEIFRTVRLIFEERGKRVNISHTVFYTGLNLLGKMIFSASVFDPNNPESMEFKDAFSLSMKLAGTPNVADFFPFLAFLDPQRLCRQMAINFRKVHKFLDVYIQDRVAKRGKNVEQNKDADKDFLDVLLDFSGPDLTIKDIRALIFELFMAGSDTSATTIEWAMAELIRNPHTMKRVQEELDQVVGHNRRVEESDIDQLPYLHAAVKEVFRLHPPIPLLVPHQAENSCEVAGYSIPKNSKIMVNVWAIGRDPTVWEEPLKFIPERFLEGDKSKIEYKGQDFELLPFGAGRRICMGLPLAHKMVHLVLAALAHSFDWALPDGLPSEKLDMSDELGAALKKAQELTAIPTPRLPHHLY
uniref:CYP76AA69 n=1 Tax=Taxus chinensis TaxID=29808 RepID=A0A291FB20_TAXCH|nr:CYP76AA69 [Taxus chinensis]